MTSSSHSSAKVSRQAELRKNYLRRCAEIGIAASDARNAEVECKSWYMNWWLGRRFQKCSPMIIPNDDEEGDDGDGDGDVSMKIATTTASTIHDDERSTSSSSTFSSRGGGGGLHYPYLSTCPDTAARQLECMKLSLLSVLKEDDGVNGDNPRFMAYVDTLAATYRARRDAAPTTLHNDAAAASMMDATWVTLQTSPKYQEWLGKNARGDPTYTLGRMSFDMFRPSNLVCSLQWTFNTVAPVDLNDRSENRPRAVPRSLQNEVYRQQHHHHHNASTLRTYDISSAFTIEPQPFTHGDESDENLPPLRGLMTTFGYTLPDPKIRDRYTVWFSGGLLEPVLPPSGVAAPPSQERPTPTPTPFERWTRVFEDRSDGRSMGRLVRVLAARLLLGADVPDVMDNVDGSMEYTFHRPIGGHGQSYVDVLYMDHNLRILRGNYGTIYVSGRMDASQP